MDRRKQKLLLALGYEAISDTIYKKGMDMEVISDQESFDDMRVRLSKKHRVVITDDGIVIEFVHNKPMDENAPSYYWRSSLPILRSYHTDPKFTAFFGILDVLSTIPKKDMVEEEKPVEEPKEEMEVEYDLETEQQYYAAEWIKDIPTPVLYRMTVAGKRVYYEMDVDGYPIIYDGATNNIANGYCDTSGALEKWKNEMRLKGKDPDDYANYRADLGTIMHYLFGLYLTGVNIKLIPTWIRKVVKEAKLRIDKYRMERILVDNIDELIEDLISFAIFCKERHVKPVLIEKMLRSSRLKVASSVDAVVEMDSEPETVEIEVETGEFYKTGAKKGQPKTEKKKIKRCRRIFAILDFKSNRKGNFYDEYAFQLELYRRMILENYGKILEIEEIYNFAPGDPTAKTSQYKLKRQTDNPILNMATVVYLQGKYKFEKTNYTVTSRIGSLDIKGDFELNGLIRKESLRDYIYRVMSERRG
nr:MAG TPA: Mitochondrial genome maintenance exonuclease 1, DNA complex, DNA exonuclease [Caudoviricetes sp.]